MAGPDNTKKAIIYIIALIAAASLFLYLGLTIKQADRKSVV